MFSLFKNIVCSKNKPKNGHILVSVKCCILGTPKNISPLSFKIS